MNQKYETYLLYGLVILVLGVLVYSLSNLIQTSSSEPILDATRSSPPIGTAQDTGFRPIMTGTTNPGEVEITLTPHKPENGRIEVDIAANTHSVDLNQFDLKEITTLRYAGGEAKPISTPSLNGHHSSGILIFDVDADAFTITIEGIPNVDERVFDWT